jgi:glutamine synthetase
MKEHIANKVIKDTLNNVESDNVKLILLQFSDLHGNIKSVMIPVQKLEESMTKGTWFDGSSIEGFTRIHESDMYLLPDPETYAVISWATSDHKIGRFICDIYTPDNKPFEGDPRQILKKAIQEAEDMGLIFNTGPELEFYLFKNKNGDISTETHDRAGYFDFSPRDLASRVRRDVILALQGMNLEVEMSHHEVGPGQHEIDFKYSDALKSADNCITFKHCVKSIALKHDLHASFMPKPLFGVNGSGMHVHQSLVDKKTNKTVMYDSEDKYNLSSTAKSFIAGQLKHIKAITSIISPTVNSYKRLVPGYEAPVYICWAKINRSALIRVPRVSPGREQATRMELRCPDPSCNPYLAFAVMLKAGLEGIKNNLTPPEPIEEDVFGFDDNELLKRRIELLPGSLNQALQELKKDQVVQDALGKHAYEKYLTGKSLEWADYRLHVSQWELNKYYDSC